MAIYVFNIELFKINKTATLKLFQFHFILVGYHQTWTNEYENYIKSLRAILTQLFKTIFGYLRNRLTYTNIKDSNENNPKISAAICRLFCDERIEGASTTTAAAAIKTLS